LNATGSNFWKHEVSAEAEFRRKYEEIWGVGSIADLPRWDASEQVPGDDKEASTILEDEHVPTDQKERVMTGVRLGGMVDPSDNMETNREAPTIREDKHSLKGPTREGDHLPYNQQARSMLRLGPGKLVDGSKNTETNARISTSEGYISQAYHDQRWFMMIERPGGVVDGAKTMEMNTESLPQDKSTLYDLPKCIRRAFNPPFNSKTRSLIVDRYWEIRFAALHEHEGSSTTMHDFLSPDFKRALIGHDCSSTIRTLWEMLPVCDRDIYWPELMYMALKDYPEKALNVLVATCSRDFFPRGAINDTMNFITSHYFRARDKPAQSEISKFVGVISYLLQLEKSFKIDSDSMYLIAMSLDLEHLISFYQMLEKCCANVHPHTLMHIASRLAKGGETVLAMKVLQRINELNFDFGTARMGSVCTTILHSKYRTSSDTLSDSEVFQFMLECGLKPNIIVYNTLILNAAYLGNFETAWKIHDMLRESGSEANEYTYSILLNDAKIRNDEASVSRALCLVQEKKICNAHIITDLLHWVYLSHPHTQGIHHQGSTDNGAQHPSTPYGQMLPIYQEHFKPNLISQLLCATQNSSTNSTINRGSIFLERQGPVMEAPVPTMHVMLTAFIRSSHPLHVRALFFLLLKVSRFDDPLIRGLWSSTYFWNLLIKRFGEFRETLHLCPQIIEYMLKGYWTATMFEADSAGFNRSRVPISSESEVELDGGRNSVDDLFLRWSGETKSTERSSSQTFPKAEDDSLDSIPIPVPQPDIGTWSILLHAFMGHRQNRAAERVLELMVARGLEPNMVTWNSLAQGYAKMQDVSMAADAIDRMEKAGFEADEITIKGLAWIQDRRALVEAMRANGQSTSNRPFRSTKTYDQEIFSLANNVLIAEEKLNGSLGISLPPEVRDIVSSQPKIYRHLSQALQTRHEDRECLLG